MGEQDRIGGQYKYETLWTAYGIPIQDQNQKTKMKNITDVDDEGELDWGEETVQSMI